MRTRKRYTMATGAGAPEAVIRHRPGTIKIKEDSAMKRSPLAHRSRRRDRVLTDGARPAVERLESRSMLAAAGLASIPLKPPVVGTTAAGLVSSAVPGFVAGIPRTVTPPGAPTGVTATAGDGRATLIWTAPTDAGGALRLAYAVQLSRDGGATWTTAALRVDGTRAVVPLLTNGTPYVFRVAAINRAGLGAYSAPSAPVTPVGVALPGAPTNVQAVAGSGRVTLTWTAPTNTGGAAKLGYLVQTSTDGGTTWTTVSLRFERATAVIPFLKNGTTYTFRVAAFNRAGQGSFSDPSAAVTPVAASG